MVNRVSRQLFRQRHPVATTTTTTTEIANNTLTTATATIITKVNNLFILIELVRQKRQDNCLAYTFFRVRILISPV